MISITWEADEHGNGAFKASENDEIIGLMRANISGKIMTVLHTEVDHLHEGKGIAHQLMDKMLVYARENQLRVIPRCPFVIAEFRKDPALYEDVWKPEK
jgi:predicted GNAT family acetyltransferase